MSYNYQDAPRESQQEYFGKVHTDNKETLYNALKRIEELEKENADLKKRLVSARAEFQRQYKENEELRNNGFTVSAMAEQQLKVAIEKGKQLEKDFRICEQNADTYYDQLTKAKEIIKGLYFIIQSRIDYENNTGIADEMWRAEQFLKEIEK